MSGTVTHIRRFLETVIPETGACCAALARDGRFRHQWFDGREYFIQWVINSAPLLTVDAYLSFATYKERTSRRRSNVKLLQAIPLDVDIGKEGGYSTLKEAQQALMGHLNAGRLPRPMWAVKSGNGMHLYWVFDRPLDVEIWRSLALRFKQLLKSVDPKLAVDTARVTDPVGLLRIPGTQNFKDPNNPKVVQIIAHNPKNIHSVESFERWLPEKRGQAAMAGQAARSTAGMVSDVDEALLGREPVFGAELKAACPAFAYIIANRARAKYPEWWAGVQLCAYLEDGAAYVHEVSRDHPTYDPDAVDEKFSQALRSRSENIGPFTCEAIREAIGTDSPCRNCPFNGQVKTPIVAAWKHRRQQQEQKLIEQASSITASEAERIRAAFKLVSDAFGRDLIMSVDGVVKAVVEVDEEEGTITMEEAFPAIVVPLRKLEGNGKLHLEVGIVDPKEMRIRSRHLLAAEDFGTSTSQHKVMRALNAFMPVGGGRLEALYRRYIGALAAAANKLQDRQQVYDQMGPAQAWLDGKKRDAFVLGSRLYIHDGQKVHATQASVPHSVASNRIGELAPNGSRENVFSALRALLPRMRPEALYYFLASPASMLLHLTDVSGVIVHLSGPSGYGKTTLNRLSSALFGRPKDTEAVPRDTRNAMEAKLHALNVLPYYMDEWTPTLMADSGGIVDLVYSIVNGRGRDRAKRNGELQERRAQWRLAMFSTGNVGFSKLLYAVGYSAVSEALLKRVVDLKVDNDRFFLDQANGQLMALNEQLYDNYGWFADWLVEVYLKNKKKLKQYIEAAYQALNDRYGHAYRFYNALHACIYVLSGILNKKLGGVIQMNLLDLVYEKLTKREQEAVQEIEEAEEPIGRLIDCLSYAGTNTAIFKEKDGELDLLSGPMDTVHARVEIYQDRVDIWYEHTALERAVTAFDRKMSLRIFLEQLEREGRLLRPANGKLFELRPLASDVPDRNGVVRVRPPQRCYHFRLDPSEFMV